MADYAPWPIGIVGTVRAVRNLGLDGVSDVRTTFDLIAGMFGFRHVGEDNWYEFKRWCHVENIEFTLAQGPYVMAILKAMAIKRGRTAVSTLSSE